MPKTNLTLQQRFEKHVRIPEDRQLLLRLGRRLLSDLHVVLRRKEIEARFDLCLRVSDAGAHQEHEHGDAHSQ